MNHVEMCVSNVLKFKHEFLQGGERAHVKCFGLCFQLAVAHAPFNRQPESLDGPNVLPLFEMGGFSFSKSKGEVIKIEGSERVKEFGPFLIQNS